MKLKSLIPFLLLAALILSACAPSVAAKSVSVSEAVSSEGGQVKCVRESDATRLLIQSVEGFCLQFPAEYDLVIPTQNEIVLVKGSMLNHVEPGAYVNWRPAEDKTVEQAADQLEADYAVPGMEVTRTSFTIGGEPAIVLDGLTGQDVNRQVLVVRGDRLYQLSFMPMDGSDAAEQMYETIVRSFNFHPESNACPDCPEVESSGEGQLVKDPQTAMISGWVWHDQCDSGKDGQAAPASTPNGCVEEDSVLGQYHANSVLSVGEPLIEGLVVTLGEGSCPATGLLETFTITTDLSYSFSDLSAGIYCVSIDPQREPNFSILRPGVWTYPEVAQGVISTTIIVEPGEYKGDINFGWDHQFLP